jgi:hypothetical protein
MRKLACVLVILAAALLSMGSNVVIMLKKPAASSLTVYDTFTGGCADWTKDAGTGTMACAGSVLKYTSYSSLNVWDVVPLRYSSSDTTSDDQYSAVKLSNTVDFFTGPMLRSAGASGWKHGVLVRPGQTAKIYWIGVNGTTNTADFRDDTTKYLGLCTNGSITPTYNDSVGAEISGSAGSQSLKMYFWASASPPERPWTTGLVCTCTGTSTSCSADGAGWSATSGTQSITQPTGKGIGLLYLELDTNTASDWDDFRGGDK